MTPAAESRFPGVIDAAGPICAAYFAVALALARLSPVIGGYGTSAPNPPLPSSPPASNARHRMDPPIRSVPCHPKWTAPPYVR